MLTTRARLAYACAAIVLMLATLAFAVRKPGDAALYPPPPGAKGISIYLVDNGFHTNLAVPTARLAGDGPLAKLARAQGAPFTEIGWGDARFYVETGVTPARVLDAFRALFAPGNPSAVMIEPLHAAPDRIWSSGVTRIELSEAGFARMTAGIDRSFATANGAPVAVPGGVGHFFRSAEHFSLAHLCNHWTADRLHDAGLQVRPVLDTLPAGLVFDLETGGATVHRSARP